MTQALVSGGSGSIDRLLVRCRRGLEGRLVHVHLRIEAAAELVAALRAEPVRCGLTHLATPRDRARGSDVLLNLAVKTGLLAERARRQRATATGTRAAVDAARKARVALPLPCASEAALLTGGPCIEAEEAVCRDET